MGLGVEGVFLLGVYIVFMIIREIVEGLGIGVVEDYMCR